MNKRIFLPLLFLLVGIFPALANEGYSKPGQLTVQAGLGPYWGYGGGLNIQAGADWGLGQVFFAPDVPLDLGVSGRVGVFTPLLLNAAAFGTAHFSWTYLKPRWDWLNHLESYAGVGVQVIPGLSLAGYLGVGYHFDSHWALFLEASALDYGGTVIGASYRF